MFSDIELMREIQRANSVQPRGADCQGDVIQILRISHSAAAALAAVLGHIHRDDLVGAARKAAHHRAAIEGVLAQLPQNPPSRPLIDNGGNK